MDDKKQKAVVIEISEDEMEYDHKLIIDIKQKEQTTQVSQQMKEDDEEISIDDIKKMIEISHEEGRSSSLSCIYRVPSTIRLLNHKAYTPKVVSIGPFHHGNVRLRDMERYKTIMFNTFARDKDLNSLIELARKYEPNVRASYFDSINYNKKDLVKLILVDSAFIIELFMMKYKGNINEDPKLSQLWLTEAIRKDLLLLENQLPFFFLKKLYNVAFPCNRRGDLPSFLELTYSYFAFFNKQRLEHNRNIKHFTDLLRLFYLSRTQPRRDAYQGDDSDQLKYSANELQEAGVKLRKSTSKCLLDLKFSKSVLEIPQINIDDGTETLFRNIIALEQCLYYDKSYFTDYIFVWDTLVNTNKDVEVLSHEDIIDNWLSDGNEAATLFNGLAKNVSQGKFNSTYADICGRLNKFCQDPCHKTMASLRRGYCNTRWQTMASIAAIILLILTITQTVCSIFQVV
ncbi:UPF0481 protein At3g47200-like [Neltuma alba]|uniref:UPF0481 protein At3g47200-like n=1 Tax=Neltuma alba TaxID=207710 RepID=UPI0010A4FBFB|nr:UPF0481 protein At3g47200-like [Prosopis alba]